MAASVSGCIKLHSLLKDLCGNGMINPSGDVAMQGVCMAGGIKLQGPSQHSAFESVAALADGCHWS